jgi:mannan endo-1,4-beta-mannosidase
MERFVHVNAYYLQDEFGQGAPQKSLDALDACVALGVRVVRTWAFNDDAAKSSRMQDGLGRPREAGLVALDRVLAEARARNLRLILPLVNFWSAYGGIWQWLRWAGFSVDDAARANPESIAAKFFGEPIMRDAYRAHVERLLARKNTLTGIVYGDDDTVLAWELMNEPRRAPDDWVAFAAGCVRRNAGQLVGLGDEGARDLPMLDYASLHFYPEKHGGGGDLAGFGLGAITDAARRVTRPLVVGEFGLTNAVADRADCYRRWIDRAREEGVAGIGPWLLGHAGRRPEDDESFTFFRGDAVFDVIRVANAAFP